MAPLAAILVCDPERLKFNQDGVWSIYFWIIARIFFLLTLLFGQLVTYISSCFNAACMICPHSQYLVVLLIICRYPQSRILFTLVRKIVLAIISRNFKSLWSKYDFIVNWNRFYSKIVHPMEQRRKRKRRF